MTMSSDFDIIRSENVSPKMFPSQRELIAMSHPPCWNYICCKFYLSISDKKKKKFCSIVGYYVIFFECSQSIHFNKRFLIIICYVVMRCVKFLINKLSVSSTKQSNYCYAPTAIGAIYIKNILYIICIYMVIFTQNLCIYMYISIRYKFVLLIN